MRNLFVRVVGYLSACMLLFGGVTCAQALSLEFKSVGTLTAPSAEVWLMDRGSVGIGAFDITFNFDPLLLSFNNVIFGSYLGALDPLAFETVTGTDTPSSSTGRAYEVSLLNPLPFQPDDFVLFTTKFNSLGSGTSPLMFTDVLLSDESGAAITPSQLANGSLDANPIPEPGTVLLLTAGLALLAACRRKGRI